MTSTPPPVFFRRCSPTQPLFDLSSLLMQIYCACRRHFHVINKHLRSNRPSDFDALEEAFPSGATIILPGLIEHPPHLLAGGKNLRKMWQPPGQFQSKKCTKDSSLTVFFFFCPAKWECGRRERVMGDRAYCGPFPNGPCLHWLLTECRCVASGENASVPWVHTGLQKPHCVEGSFYSPSYTQSRTQSRPLVLCIYFLPVFFSLSF